ncbi:Ig-like domain (group 2) [Xylanibacter ruminicola]|uniref:Ig-like domain (Group 2) n=1 Tax=Xylanibacter ruminicola TaxID=839 RepID=A0A1H4AHD9_XYLRU|nr:Ig-like domain-containing protein [Xylanibacter ruminicola]SEA35168.1 Ig-like domain (group 2) [Xylanibacter ruminicola]
MKRIIRQILGWGMMLTLPLMMTSCEEFFAWLDRPVTPTIQVLKAQVTMKVGESKPLRAYSQDHVVLLYSSENPAVATVDANGLITAVGAGTTKITIKAQGEDDYYRTEIFSENTTTVEVTVSKNDGSISFATANNVIKNYGDGAFTIPLTIVGDGTVIYTSSNTNVATVDANGNVNIIDGGTAIITATTADTDDYAYEKKTVEYTLKVYRTIDLSTLTSDFTAKDNYILTGTLAGSYKICIAANANVELKDATINGIGVNQWAGLTCLGNATITITGTNTIKTFFSDYPGIQAGPTGKTLTIDGTGSLTATGGHWAAGIGCANVDSPCGDITINGGTIKATTGLGAGIGSASANSSCGAITINGGTVDASASSDGVGIGCGESNSLCGNIIISGGIVKASSDGDGAGIGSGKKNSLCGNIIISGGTVDASSAGEGAGIGSGFQSAFGSITITSDITQVKATTNSNFAWPIGKGTMDTNSTGDIIIGGATVTSKSWDGTGQTGLTLTGAGTNTWKLN